MLITVEQLLESYDYVIVGAGSAGCVIANRLSADSSVQVLLLEAGGVNQSILIDMPSALSLPMHDHRFNWNYRTNPEPGLENRRIACPRGRGLGGSWAINGMVYLRGNAMDYDSWQRLIGDSITNWSYESVLPYFKRMETCLEPNADYRYRGDCGPVVATQGEFANPLYEAFLNAAKEAGHFLSPDLNGYRQEGFGAFPMTVDEGIRCSTNRAYLRPVSARKNLHIMTSATVKRLEIKNHRAHSVEWFVDGNRRITQAAKEIVVTAGAIESPCILQRSGIGPGAILKRYNIPVVKDLAVGTNLMDHLEIYLQQACERDLSLNRYWNPFGKAWIGLQWLALKTGYGATNHFEAGGFARSRSDIDWPDTQFHFLPAAMNYDGTSIAPSPGYQLHVGPSLPRSRGSVTISSPDLGPKPSVCFGYLSDERDMQVFVRSIEMAREIIRQPSLSSISGREIQPGSSVQTSRHLAEWIRRNAQSAYHPCGTCKMGLDASAVVDPKGCIHDLKGIRVADSSIFPSIPNSNLNAPTIMVAEKIAAEITGETLAPETAQYFGKNTNQ